MRRCRGEIYGSALFVPRTTDPTGVRDQTSFSSGVFLSRRVDIFLLFGFGLSPPLARGGRGKFFSAYNNEPLARMGCFTCPPQWLFATVPKPSLGDAAASVACLQALYAHSASRGITRVCTEYSAFDGMHGDVVNAKRARSGLVLNSKLD